MRLTVSNANPFPVAVEVPIGRAGQQTPLDPTVPLLPVDGVATWRVMLAANGSAILSYGHR